MSKPVLLFYSQHAEGIGQLIRCLALARELKKNCRVVVLCSGPLLPEVAIPNSVDVVQLPPLSRAIDDDSPGPDAARSLQQTLNLRREIILDTYAELKPRVVIIELFPFGRRLLEDELMPLLERARNGNGNGTHILCSLRDILVGDRGSARHNDDKTAGILERYFDAVLVHSDSMFARLEESFQPHNTLSTPVHYTGFVVSGLHPYNVRTIREKRVLVSAGSGMVGMPLFSAAVEAHRLLWEVERLPMTLIGGPLLQAEHWNRLKDSTSHMPGLTLKRSVPDLSYELCRVAWSVSQCGYNAAMEIVTSGTPALFVPYRYGPKIEQIDRASRLTHWGVSRLLMPHHVNGASLANEIHQLMKFRVKETSFSFNGAENTAAIVDRMLRGDAAHVPQAAVSLH